VTFAHKPATSGYLYILAAATLWGASVVAARVLVRDLPPMVLTHLTVLISAGGMGCAIAVLRPRLLRVPLRELWGIALVGGVGFAGAATLLNYSIQQTNAATAIVLNYLAPALILAWSAVRGSERLTVRKVTAAIMCVAGCALTVGLAEGKLLFHAKGIAAGLGAAVAFSFFTVYSKPIVQRNSSFTFTLYAFLAASGFLFVFQRPSALAVAFESAPRAVGVMAYVLCLCALPPVLFFRGLRTVPESGAAVACSFEIVVTALGGWVLLSESMLLSQVLGAAMVMASVALLESGGPPASVPASTHQVPLPDDGGP
jgi:drug/metabolite transporter, DME family